MVLPILHTIAYTSEKLLNLAVVHVGDCLGCEDAIQRTEEAILDPKICNVVNEDQKRVLLLVSILQTIRQYGHWLVIITHVVVRLELVNDVRGCGRIAG